jgi:para-nitrobenzyl esterase
VDKNDCDLARRLFVQRAASMSLLLPAAGAITRAFAAAEIPHQNAIGSTEYGKIKGVRSGDSFVFKGVPYARTARRLARPAPPAAWTGVRDALAFGPRAIQVAATLDGMSESCQLLNVWTPALDRGKRPVMVWLHGGGFMNGSANTDLYDGADLNREGDVVVVTLNHRLGAFGYLYVPEAGADHDASGCAGMLDIVAALRWVRNNIGHFGGDPRNVTIFGESGGGGKVLALMAMPSAKGLFHRAIVQSGALLRTAITPEQGRKTTMDILAEMKLSPSQVQQLLDAPAEQLLKAQAAVLARAGTPGSGGSPAQRPFSPIIDGKEIPSQPFDPVAPTFSASVPLMIGTNKDESRLFFVSTSKLYALEMSELRSRLQPLLGESTDTVLAVYSKTRPNASASDLFFAISTAQMYGYTSVRVAERKAQQSRAPVYMYQFAYEGTQTAGNPPVALKAAHSLEIPFVFAHPRPNADKSIAESESKLAEQMSSAWIAFARTGDPNVKGELEWPKFTPKTRATMVFDTTSAVVNDPHPEERQLWERLLTGSERN